MYESDAEKSEEEWKACNDFDTLMTANEIMGDKERLKKALSAGEKRQKKITATLDNAKS